ncbi:MAG: hypothetical protein SFV54_06055 [Bryobacteraceae bacterium]|nr:hypothetical protein [Bryobacteraceae bacterium]
MQTLELTIGAPSVVVRTLDAFRKKRNTSDYERADVVSEVEVEEIQRMAAALRRDVLAWIKAQHPDLAP